VRDGGQFEDLLNSQNAMSNWTNDCGGWTEERLGRLFRELGGGWPFTEREDERVRNLAAAGFAEIAGKFQSSGTSKGKNDLDLLKFNLEVLKCLRSEIRTEHDLINHRLGWCMTSQAFLVGAFAVTRKSGADPFVFDFGLPILGIALCFAVMFPLGWARRTMDYLRLIEGSFFASNVGLARVLYLDSRDERAEEKRPKWYHPVSVTIPALMPALFVLFWAAAVGRKLQWW
jgi:hypothetical protein